MTSQQQSPTGTIENTKTSVAIEEEVRLRVGETDYVLIPHEHSFVPFNATTAPVPFIVYRTKPEQIMTREALKVFRETILDRDDVFQPAFATHVVFYGNGEQRLEMSKDAVEELLDWGAKWSFVEGDSSHPVAPGPYVFAKEKVWQPWKVYYDVNGAFMKGGLDGRVIVPSRCYYNPSTSRPLDGLRVAVKDNIDVKGHKTTLNNRGWRDLYPPASENADCVQLLIDAGAIIVGKVKLQAMIVREEPVEAVEFTDPFNPRGDGYQVPSGSSSGSAAAIASYDWLDLSLGSDTNGSVRKPAHYNGCHTIRPTTDIMNTDGVVGFFPQFDMPGFFGRDLAHFPEIISVWYGKSPMLLQPSKIPVRILYPTDYLPTSNNDQSLAIDKFITALETSLQVERTPVCIAERWKEDRPDGPHNADISKYLKDAGSTSSFRADYEKKFGVPPFVHRYEHWLWDVGKSVTKEWRQECLRRCEVYRSWLLNSVFESTSQDKLTIMVLPIEVGKPNYRDSPEPGYQLLNGYASLNLSPIMRAPEVTAIVGETEFMSEVTGKPAPYPIAASVLGPPGSDLIITQLTIEAMKKAQIPVEVQTGASVYKSSR
ncbi:amidase [Nemania sp. FL0031]|nr:amidase [Nemania sp. FL0031]